MLKGTALRRMVMSLLETGRHPMTVFMTSLWTRNPAPCSCLSSFPLKKTFCPSSVVVTPKFFHLIPPSPRMFHLYLSISCVFHVPMVMLSLQRIFYDAPVAYLTPPSWCRAEGVVLVDPGGDRSGMVWLLWYRHDTTTIKRISEIQTDCTLVIFSSLSVNAGC